MGSENQLESFDSSLFNIEEVRRIEMTVSCLDSAEIPKVSSAGEFGIDDYGPFQIMHNGLKITKDCYQGPWMTKVIELLRGHHEPQEELAFYEVMKVLREDPSNFQEQTILELGSFWGYYSLWFAKEFPKSRVVCVEPDPIHMAVGQQNFRRNEVEGYFINAQISREDKLRSRFLCVSDGMERKIESLAFSGVMERAGLTEVDLVHVDIQGSEIDLLLDLPNVLRSKKIRFMLISTHDLSISGSPTTHQDSLKILKDNGAFIICEHSVSESFSGDGFILASFFEKDKEIEISISYNRGKNSLFGEWEPRLGSVINSKSWRMTIRLRKFRNLHHFLHPHNRQFRLGKC